MSPFQYLRYFTATRQRDTPYGKVPLLVTKGTSPWYTVSMKSLTQEMRSLLEKEVPILRAEIQALYKKLDKTYHLQGANLPITFGFDEDMLGSYTPAGPDQTEHFHFSLAFIAYCQEKHIPKSDREDLYKHEYAHYMTRYIEIPKEFQWQSGPHGSAWKYCCSLIGAVPSATYIFGESLRSQDYDKVLTNPINDKSIPIRDRYRQEKAYQDKKNSTVQYTIGDHVAHPKFGQGIIEEIEPMQGSVRLTIRFGEEVKKIDQKWLLKTKYKRAGDK